MTTLRFDDTELRTGDTSLLVFLSTIRRQAQARGLVFDDGGLPDAARRLLGLLSAEAFSPVPRSASVSANWDLAPIQGKRIKSEPCSRIEFSNKLKRLNAERASCRS